MGDLERIKKQFKLQPHPEGGFYSAGYRSPEFLRSEGLPHRYNAPRNLYSSIYFMVTNTSSSRFHKLKTDEMWHFYHGDPVSLHLISESGHYTKIELSAEVGKERFMYLVKKNTWMAASCESIEKNYSLTGCTLAPGFEYDDFELGKRNELIASFPHLSDVIEKFT